jgi:hypothetical protein
VVFGEGRVGWGEEDGAGDFVAGWHFCGCGLFVVLGDGFYVLMRGFVWCA